MTRVAERHQVPPPAVALVAVEVVHAIVDAGEELGVINGHEPAPGVQPTRRIAQAVANSGATEDVIESVMAAHIAIVG
ncbi:MAG TPA: hypothetical protein VII66_00850 [Gemmatimonadaceae bacterium]